MSNLENEIKKLGLSDKEAKVYLTVLELGQAPVAEISVHSGVVRVTTYVILEELKKKGLVSTFLKGKKTYFSVEPPERLSHLFEIEERRLKENFSDLKKILPDLKEIYESRGERPKIRFFEGDEGINSLREDILKTKTKFLYQILPIDIIAKNLSEKKFQNEKVKKLYNIPSKSIYYNKKGKIFPGKLNKAEYKFLADKFETEIIIYGEKTAFINVKKKPTGIIIDDFSVSQTVKIFFETLWKFLK
ncbi:MAG: Transcriptional regulator, TrmB [Candidatus Giovannonibacteria bacterium GW2011_GWC2_44_8]|uniref:Transcriptional regulator, TrmB n=1 Tax=Candidatus Giovannonibacteria bacterium GW2011_GWC2_44_8 TaxID=1618657 RepID=A0A0G1MY26_9BACT|nr:MAG: Transcriptional regulator, TrmB [Parcubacteria group bacterium GW2011_GWB1_43_6]KKT76854.1 MAG: Transcriptional regulator, TrmB [Candidatus Giovannonibacteria bacterium GW2011_GWC2_44_8]